MPPHSGRGRLTRGTAALLAAVLGFAVFAPTLGYEFVWDDRATVLFNREIRSLANAPSFFTGHAFTGASEDLRDITVIQYYRPVWVLSLALDHAVWGVNPLGYHLSNLLLHALASALTAWLVFALAGSAAAAALAGMLFAVHPVHAEAVAWVSARNELLLAVFLLVAFIAYLRVRRGAGWGAKAACIAAYAAALFSKETAALFPAIVLLYEWALRWQKPARAAAARAPGAAAARAPGAATARTPGAAAAPSPWARYGWGLALAAIAVAFMALRAAIVAPLPVHDPLTTRIATAPGLVLEYLRLLFFPAGLAVLHAFEPVTSPLSPATLVPLALLMGIVALLAWAFRFEPHLGFGLGWILIALAPVSGLPALLQPTPLAERYLYLPSVGWAIVVGSLLARVLAPAGAPSRPAPRIPARAWQAAALAAIPVFAGASLIHSRPWRNELTLATRMCRDVPRSALAHSSLGLARYRLERWPEAAEEFALAASLRPSDPWSHYYLGCSLRRARRPEPAEGALRDALDLGMRYAPAHLELGAALEAGGRLEEAEHECRAAIALDSTLVEAHSGLGRVLYRAGRFEAAEAAYRLALALRPDDGRTRSNLGALYMAQRRWDDAIAELERARADAPRLAEAYFNLGSALFIRRRLPEAEQALRAGLALEPGAQDEHLELCRVLLAQGRNEEAGREAREVLRATPADSSLRDAATRLLEEARRRP